MNEKKVENMFTLDRAGAMAKEAGSKLLGSLTCRCLIMLRLEFCFCAGHVSCGGMQFLFMHG